MSEINIHPKFTLQGISFHDKASFLTLIQTRFSDSYSFLKDLLDESATISVHTSGSTGAPKDISISKKAMLNSAKATGLFFNLPAKTKALHCLSTEYIAGKMMWVRAIYLGWELAVVQPNSNPLKENVLSFDFAAMVPLQAQNSLHDLNRIDKLIIGGGSISFSLEKELVKLKTTVFQTYGMTETITHVAVKKISNNRENLYKSLPNVKLSLDDRACLIIDAPNVSDKIVITNDLVKLHSNTQFEWLGRIDNVINSGGIKFFPEQIEKKLAPFIINPFIITSLPDTILGEKLILLIETSTKDIELNSPFFTKVLSKYEIPKAIYYINEFVYTSNSKIKRTDTLQLIHK
ncbi:MAG TPA: O-succinylbenzoic acid--CoA ligase [Lutibacter sp.]|nr:O-succinylbenzoic acid--CoA ligase [Lutibacter sp.]